MFQCFAMEEPHGLVNMFDVTETRSVTSSYSLLHLANTSYSLPEEKLQLRLPLHLGLASVQKVLKRAATLIQMPRNHQKRKICLALMLMMTINLYLGNVGV